MSKAVTALNGATFEGFVTVRDAGLTGMITIRGNFKSTKFKAAVKAVLDMAVPKQRVVATTGDKTLLWMSPDELLLVLPYEAVDAMIASLAVAFADLHALAVDVSDARSVFKVSGEKSREAVAKLAPVDLSEVFQMGEIRRTRLAQVPAAFWLSDADEFTVVAFRSVANYVMGILSAAAQDGGEVNYL
ncbi:MAG: sarcosine oxidase subunit gamma [Halocynthiibacter sp.]